MTIRGIAARPRRHRPIRRLSRSQTSAEISDGPHEAQKRPARPIHCCWTAVSMQGAPRDRLLPNLRGSDEQLVAAGDSLPLRGKGAEQQLGLVQLGPCEHQSQLPAAEGGLDPLKRVDPDLGGAVSVPRGGNAAAGDRRSTSRSQSQRSD